MPFCHLKRHSRRDLFTCNLSLKALLTFNTQYQTSYLSVMPTNLYGPGDNLDLENSHVLPALIRKFHEAKCTGAKTVTVWGTRTPRREFLHVDDMAAGCLYLLNLPASDYSSIINGFKPTTVNLGAGTDVTIREQAEMIMEIVGFQGELVFDTGKPDGPPKAARCFTNEQPGLASHDATQGRDQ